MYQTQIFFQIIKDLAWNNDQLGPLYIPKAGDKIDLSINTLPLYKKIITDYEYNELSVVEGDILINGKIEQEYII
jgi:signal peptidase I